MTKKKTTLKALGPTVSAFPAGDANTMMAIEAQELGRLVPRFYDREELGVEKFLHAIDPRTEPENVTFTLPEIMSIWFESYTGAEVTLAFAEFVKGVACISILVEPGELVTVKDVIRVLAEEVAVGGELPRIDLDFADDVRTCLLAIFKNGEPISWRPLMAFCLGVFWLLGFVLDVDKAVGKYSPQEFARRLAVHYGELGYLPG